MGTPTSTTSDPQSYLLTTFIDLSCSNTGSSTEPDVDLFLWTNWDEIIGNNDVTIANETTAPSAKCIIENFYDALSDYTNVAKSGAEFKYFATAGLVVGTQLYDYDTDLPLTSAGLGLYVPNNLGEPSNSALDANNPASNPPDEYDIIIYNSSGVITAIVQYNQIYSGCNNDVPTTFDRVFGNTGLTLIGSSGETQDYLYYGTYPMPPDHYPPACANVYGQGRLFTPSTQYNPNPFYQGGITYQGEYIYKASGDSWTSVGTQVYLDSSGNIPNTSTETTRVYLIQVDTGGATEPPSRFRYSPGGVVNPYTFPNWWIITLDTAGQVSSSTLYDNTGCF